MDKNMSSTQNIMDPNTFFCRQLHIMPKTIPQTKATETEMQTDRDTQTDRQRQRDRQTDRQTDGLKVLHNMFHRQVPRFDRRTEDRHRRHS